MQKVKAVKGVMEVILNVKVIVNVLGGRRKIKQEDKIMIKQEDKMISFLIYLALTMLMKRMLNKFT